MMPHISPLYPVSKYGMNKLNMTVEIRLAPLIMIVKPIPRPQQRHRGRPIARHVLLVESGSLAT